MRLLDLPLELLSEIAAQTTRRELRNIRLTCRALRVASDLAFFSELVLNTDWLKEPNTSVNEMLEDLASGTTNWTRYATTLRVLRTSKQIEDFGQIPPWMKINAFCPGFSSARRELLRRALSGSALPRLRDAIWQVDGFEFPWIVETIEEAFPQLVREERATTGDVTKLIPELK